jgi:hypothetical protein
MRRQTMSVARSKRIADQLVEDSDLHDFPSFAERFLRVMNRPETSGHGKAAQFVPLKLNPVQLDFLGKIERAHREGRPGRFVVLKARRMGFSTLIQAYMLWKCLTNRERRAFITAVDKITTGNIFRMIKSMWAHLPHGAAGADRDGRKQAKGKKFTGVVKKTEENAALGQIDAALDIRPEIRRNNDMELWFAHPLDESAGLNSRIDVAVADAVDSTRGFELHFFHGSEVAFWNDPETFMLGLMQTFSDDPETLVVLESTANGTGGYFHNQFWSGWNNRDSEGRPIDSDWESVFYAWWQMPNYTRPLPEDMTPEELLGRCDETLLGMVDEYNLTMEQAYWALRTWRDKCQQDWDKFRQEYPGKPQDAFAFSANRVFAEKDVRAIEYAVEPPIAAGDIEDSANEGVPLKELHAGDLEPRFAGGKQAGEAPLWVWSHPQEDRRYTVAVDPSSGVSSGDYTAIQVIDVQTEIQVAEYHSKMSPMDTALKAVLLARYYNDALLNWEVNGVGHAVSLGIDHLEYWALYVRENVEGSTGAGGERVGWSTNTATKPMMIGCGSHAIRQHRPIVRSARLLAEMRKFMEITERPRTKRQIEGGDERHKRVKVGAPKGEHDDLVMSWLLCLYTAQQEYRAEEDEVRRRRPPRWNHWGDDPEEGAA